MAQREDGAFVLHGRKAALSEKPYEFLSNTQKTTSSHNLSFQGAAHNRRLHASYDRPKEIISSPVSQYTKENPSIDDLEDNLRKLKVQVDSLASSLNLDYENDTNPYSSKDVNKPQWSTHINGTSSEIYNSSSVKTVPDSDWFLKPNHFVKAQENYSAVQSAGLPTFSTSSYYSVGREISGMDSMTSSVSPFDMTYSEKIPVKLGAPHVVGVKSLLPPKVPVRSRSLEKSKASVVRGRSQSLDRSHSFSPVSKKARWPRSRSQSPNRVWRPNSAKANACGQPAPRLKCSGKTSSSNRQSRSRFYRPGSVVTRSVTPLRKTKSNLSYSWSPYSIPSTSISAPSAEEISEKFLQTLTEGGVGRSVLEASPYQQELARLRLERLRVEEDLLLEIKRQQELERTRGPRPKWYEMKSSQFHYEARKNNEFLKSSKEYQSIYNYRQELTAASRNFQEHLKITHLDPV
ncbi:hypothetical protein XENTR_v10018925 [Xenopus tropicalis]|uniref:Uncharacterized protein LOC100485840 n=1 Tax=Xenopus tropicalis TaxID=8364 RepID=A0A8J0QQA5_XENTR|nr:uncharacterized protein LOC100485840 [Xenopus tropicalis]KAE8592951.1 hypothetical protein XENTR_v10018925 [Xenopus tropicalis]